MPKDTVTIKCRGTQAHGSVCSWVGDNATAKMIKILDELVKHGAVVERLSSGERSSASSEYCEAMVRCVADEASEIVKSTGVAGVEVLR